MAERIGRLDMAEVSWSIAHQAVELGDVMRLRELIEGGADVEDDAGDGWTLLRHAIDAEHDSYVQSGEPLHVDITAYLLALGANPLRRVNGITAMEEAEMRGHWLAAELMRAWIER
jgi:ankyrin repeat protein